jgi:hypothetical protein
VSSAKEFHKHNDFWHKRYEELLYRLRQKERKTNTEKSRAHSVGPRPPFGSRFPEALERAALAEVEDLFEECGIGALVPTYMRALTEFGRNAEG